MKACLIRIAACVIGILAGNVLFDMRLTFAAGCLMTLMLVIMYIVLRPLMQLIVLPFNLFLFGLLTVASDALFVLWASAWTPESSIAYWQAAVIAAVVLGVNWLFRKAFRRNVKDAAFSAVI